MLMVRIASEKYHLTDGLDVVVAGMGVVWADAVVAGAGAGA